MSSGREHSGLAVLSKEEFPTIKEMFNDKVHDTKNMVKLYTDSKVVWFQIGLFSMGSTLDTWLPIEGLTTHKMVQIPK